MYFYWKLWKFLIKLLCIIWQKSNICWKTIYLKLLQVVFWKILMQDTICRFHQNEYFVLNSGVTSCSINRLMITSARLFIISTHMTQKLSNFGKILFDLIKKHTKRTFLHLRWYSFSIIPRAINSSFIRMCFAIMTSNF